MENANSNTSFSKKLGLFFKNLLACLNHFRRYFNFYPVTAHLLCLKNGCVKYISCTFIQYSLPSRKLRPASRHSPRGRDRQA